MSVPCPALTAEAIGTFALIFFGTGAAVVDAQTHALGNTGVPLAADGSPDPRQTPDSAWTSLLLGGKT
jgi:hypothetical protein